MRKLIAVAAAACAVAVSVAGISSAATPKLAGKTGPGFTITLKKGAAKVTKLAPGKYSFTIVDASNIHDFRIIGPGLNRALTTVSFTGTKTVTLTLKAGKYRYVCTPHASTMKGSFTVG